MRIKEHALLNNILKIHKGIIPSSGRNRVQNYNEPKIVKKLKTGESVNSNNDSSKLNRLPSNQSILDQSQQSIVSNCNSVKNPKILYASLLPNYDPREISPTIYRKFPIRWIFGHKTPSTNNISMDLSPIKKRKMKLKPILTPIVKDKVNSNFFDKKASFIKKSMLGRDPILRQSKEIKKRAMSFIQKMNIDESLSEIAKNSDDLNSELVDEELLNKYKSKDNYNDVNELEHDNNKEEDIAKLKAEIINDVEKLASDRENKEEEKEENSKEEENNKDKEENKEDEGEEEEEDEDHIEMCENEDEQEALEFLNKNSLVRGILQNEYKKFEKIESKDVKDYLMVQRILAEKKVNDRRAKLDPLKKCKSVDDLSKVDTASHLANDDYFKMHNRLKPIKINKVFGLNKVSHLSNRHPFFQCNSRTTLPILFIQDDTLNEYTKQGINYRDRDRFEIVCDDAYDLDKVKIP